MEGNEIIEIFKDIAVEESQYAPSFTVDCSGISPDGHFGVDDVIIKPINDIEEIHLKFR